MATKKVLSRNVAIALALIAIGVQIFTTCKKKTDQTPPPTGGQQQGAPQANSTGTIHLEMGVPTGGDGEPAYLLVRKQYALSYNSTKNVPNWVSSNLNATYFGATERKQGQFMPDPELPSQFYHVRHQDYSNSGFDRGHMVRSEERTATREDNDATFYTTNLLPQYHDLNAGPWLRLEEFCQYLAQRKNKELYIICGGVYPKNYQTIGKGNKVAVPSQCFKIIVVLERGQRLKDVNENTTVLAALMPNVEGIGHEQWRQYQTTVDEIERQTGYDFLTAVPQNIQKAIESRKAESLALAK
jgi:endonuclease G